MYVSAVFFFTPRACVGNRGFLTSFATGWESNGKEIELFCLVFFSNNTGF